VKVTLVTYTVHRHDTIATVGMKVKVAHTRLPSVRAAGVPMGIWVCGGYGDDLPSPQTRGDSMEIFSQPEITR